MTSQHHFFFCLPATSTHVGPDFRSRAQFTCKNSWHHLLDTSLPTPLFNMINHDREVVFPSIGYVDNLANNLRDVAGVLMAKARPNGACRRCMFLEQTSANFARKQCNYKFIHDTSRKRERNVRVRKLLHPQPSRTKTHTHRTCHASSTNLSPGWAPRCTSRSTPIVGLRVALRP